MVVSEMFTDYNKIIVNYNSQNRLLLYDNSESNAYAI